MKFAVKLLLVLFLTFLATPTVLGALSESADTSAFYSLTEEELSHKEVFPSVHIPSSPDVFAYVFSEGKIYGSEVHFFDNLYGKIFIPPPERV